MFENYKVFETDFAGRPLNRDGKNRPAGQRRLLCPLRRHRGERGGDRFRQARDGIDFFPLSVDFEEKLYSVGKIPGSFLKREAAPAKRPPSPAG